MFARNKFQSINKFIRFPSAMFEIRSYNPFNIRENRKSQMEGISTIYKHPDITNIAEFVKNKLYFATLNTGRKEARNTANILFFTIDDELVYHNFYNDFGPLNLACLYRYCCKVNKKLKNPSNKNRQIVHYTSRNEEKRANAAFLISSYAVLYLNQSPKEAYKTLFMGNDLPLKPFQDASVGSSFYNIYLLDCLNAICKAATFGFFNFDDFDVAEYEKYEDMRHGDFNWMMPQKFLAFVGPSTEIGTVYHPPECYIDYFLRNGIVGVVRLNKKTYDASRFTDAGIMHYDLFMPDGTVPPRKILNKFLQLAENTKGAIAVHCKAGLGRTGSLIAAYLIKHYKMTAREAIAWIRICRPGSVIGHQQTWLENMENNLFNAGQQYKLKHYGDANVILYHKQGIYSIANQEEKKIHHSCGIAHTQTKRPHELCNHKKETKITQILGKMRGTTENSENGEDSTGKYMHKKMNSQKLTQGDKLNQIKFSRFKSYRNSQ